MGIWCGLWVWGGVALAVRKSKNSFCARFVVRRARMRMFGRGRGGVRGGPRSGLRFPGDIRLRAGSQVSTTAVRRNRIAPAPDSEIIHVQPPARQGDALDQDEMLVQHSLESAAGREATVRLRARL